MSLSLILMLAFFGLVGIIAILAAMFKCGFFKTFFFSLFSGVGGLFAFHFTSLLTGITLPVNWISLACCALGGLPSVAAMLAIKLIL